MKLKKILLFVLIFFTFLIISNNSNAYVVSEGGVDKYYLPDLPVSSENIESIFLFNDDTNEMLLLQFPTGYFLGYDRFNNIFILYDSSKTQLTNDFPNLLSFYGCSLEYVNDKLVGDKWLNYTKVGTHGVPSNFIYSNYNCVYGTTDLFPCFKGVGIITILPDNLSWEDNVIIYSDSHNSSNIYLCTPNSISNNMNWYAYKTVWDAYSFYSDTYKGIRKECSIYSYNFITNTWSLNTTGTNISMGIANWMDGIGYSYGESLKYAIFYSKLDILASDDSIGMSNTNSIFKNLYSYSSFPYILNSAEDLAKGGDDVIIMPGDFSSNESIIFKLRFNRTETPTGIFNENGEEIIYISYEEYIVPLNSASEYYCSVDNTGVGYYYKIPWSFFKDKLEVNNQYIYYISYEYQGVMYEKEIFSTYGGLTSEDKFQNALDEQTKVMEQYYQKQEEILQQQQQTSQEQLETSKGIWGTLKDVLNFINPLSEDFFVYKLIDLLIDALKSLFIPNEDFLSNYFDVLMTWFSDRLGFLSYPLELILNILNKIVNINFQEPIIQIPDIIEPSTNEKIISSTTYNLNSLLENNVFKTCHDIYFVLVDAVIVFGLVNLLKHKLEEVFTK